MPFRMSADAVFEYFKPTITKGLAVQLQPVGIHAGTEATYGPPWFVTTDGQVGSFLPIVTKLVLMNGGVEVEAVPRQNLRDFFDFVQGNSFPGSSNYRSVKDTVLWRKAYGVHDKLFRHYDSKTETKSDKTHESTYCQRCGLVLPLRNLTIDHQKPQSGGEMQAMLRVFRALGLTVSTGTGLKNRYIQTQWAPKVGGVPPLHPSQRGSNQDRYTLGNRGVLFYTVLHHYGMIGEMLEMSMHHVVNLRPMCGPCNSSLRNTNLTWLGN